MTTADTSLARRLLLFGIIGTVGLPISQFILAGQTRVHAQPPPIAITPMPPGFGASAAPRAHAFRTFPFGQQACPVDSQGLAHINGDVVVGSEVKFMVTHGWSSQLDTIDITSGSHYIFTQQRLVTGQQREAGYVAMPQAHTYQSVGESGNGTPIPPQSTPVSRRPKALQRYCYIGDRAGAGAPKTVYSSYVPWGNQNDSHRAGVGYHLDSICMYCSNTRQYSSGAVTYPMQRCPVNPIAMCYWNDGHVILYQTNALAQVQMISDGVKTSGSVPVATGTPPPNNYNVFQYSHKYFRINNTLVATPSASYPPIIPVCSWYCQYPIQPPAKMRAGQFYRSYPSSWAQKWGRQGFGETPPLDIYYVPNLHPTDPYQYRTRPRSVWQPDPGLDEWDICTGDIPGSPCSGTRASCAICVAENSVLLQGSVQITSGAGVTIPASRLRYEVWSKQCLTPGDPVCLLAVGRTDEAGNIPPRCLPLDFYSRAHGVIVKVLATDSDTYTVNPSGWGNYSVIVERGIGVERDCTTPHVNEFGIPYNPGQVFSTSQDLMPAHCGGGGATAITVNMVISSSDADDHFRAGGMFAASEMAFPITDHALARASFDVRANHTWIRYPVVGYNDMKPPSGGGPPVPVPVSSMDTVSGCMLLNFAHSFASDVLVHEYSHKVQKLTSPGMGDGQFNHLVEGYAQFYMWDFEDFRTIRGLNLLRLNTAGESGNRRFANADGDEWATAAYLHDLADDTPGEHLGDGHGHVCTDDNSSQLDIVQITSSLNGHSDISSWSQDWMNQHPGDGNIVDIADFYEAVSTPNNIGATCP